MKFGPTLAVFSGVISGCAVSPETADGGSKATAIPTTIATISKDPWGFEDKWVAVEGWALVPKDCCARVYDIPDVWDDSKPYRPFEQLDFNPEDQREPISRKFDRRHVRVVGKVDLTCVWANEMVRKGNEASRASGSDRFVMLSGFCHTSGDPSLSQAKFEIIR